MRDFAGKASRVLHSVPAFMPSIQRKCAACEEEKEVQRKPAAGGAVGAGASFARASPEAGDSTGVPSIVKAVLASAGQPLDAHTRKTFEPRFGHDFSAVRVHASDASAASAHAIRAMAYTHGNDIVFAGGQYRPETRSGQQLLAHELAHVVQQSGRNGRAAGAMTVGRADSAAEREADGIADRVVAGDRVSASDDGPAEIQRACLPAATCAAPIPGSSAEFGVAETAVEASPRARRAAMPAARQRASGHTGPARQLEKILDAAQPGLRANIHGIFIDQDLSPGTGALTMRCADMVPPITGATKPCVFVHGSLNQEALAFNTTAAATIGGVPRADWHISTVQMLTHEIQHVLFDTAARPAPAGAAGCARADVEFELSELNAIMSEFPVAFRAIAAGAPAGDPARTRLASWFNVSITNPGESIQGILKKLRCTCDCPQVNAWVIDTFNFVSASWTPAERLAFNTELRRAVWALNWPL